MIENDRAIVKPVKNAKTPKLPAFAVMTASRSDLNALRDLLDLKDAKKRNLYDGVLYCADSFSLVGPMIGAPYAVMLLETLLSWGASRILFYGWCGSISPDLEIGTVLVPTGAYIDEGTSRSYGAVYDDFARPSERICGIVREILERQNTPFREAGVWTTDAIYRETPEKVDYYRGRDASAVEMELSALFTVARYRQAEVGAVLAASDDLSGYVWKPGFKKPAFKTARERIRAAIQEICRRI